MTQQANIFCSNNTISPLGPDSQTWQFLGEYRYLLLTAQAFALQAAHPTIGAGLKEHSNSPFRLWGWAKGSIMLTWPIVYARPLDAIHKVQDLRERLRKISGKDNDGNYYSALDPETYAWLHSINFYTSLKFREVFGEMPDEIARERIFTITYLNPLRHRGGWYQTHYGSKPQHEGLLFKDPGASWLSVRYDIPSLLMVNLFARKRPFSTWQCFPILSLFQENHFIRLIDGSENRRPKN